MSCTADFNRTVLLWLGAKMRGGASGLSKARGMLLARCAGLHACQPFCSADRLAFITRSGQGL